MAQNRAEEQSKREMKLKKLLLRLVKLFMEKRKVDDKQKNTKPCEKCPDVRRYKKGETITSGGKDYVLHDNQWHVLMAKDRYDDYVENYRNPKGGRPWSRELKATFSYDQQVVQTAGWIGGGVGAAAGVTTTILERKFSIPSTPSFLAGFIWAQIDAYSAMQDRMKKHDEMVEYYRNKQ